MRKIIETFNAQATSDGDGVNITRLAGRHLQGVLNPYLMIDEINSDDATDYIGGFPTHPHRGFETITYMKAGRMRHHDHMGNKGVIEAGGVQWMTAGRGVLHSEMPEQEHGLLHGFQVWLNLPASEKMQAADYRDIASRDITEQTLPKGGLMRIISGNVEIDGNMFAGPIQKRSTQPILIDLQLNSDETVELAFNEQNRALVYVYQGSTHDTKQHQMTHYSEGDKLYIKAGKSSTALLILSGSPIDEPIVQYGPFVMNTREEIEQAFDDINNDIFV